MKGYIPVQIPTKSYIKAYVISKLGIMPLMELDNTIGHKLYDVLQHNTNERKSEFSSQRYNAQLRIYIPRRTFLHRGAYLNESNIKNFNIFIELELKTRFRELMNDYIEILPSFEANLPQVREKLGIDIEAWSDDSMRKDYYRYRKASGKPLIYNKTFARTVPSENPDNIPF